MSPALPPPPPRFWCDFCKEFTPIPHTLDPWLLATQATPALYAVKEEEEDDVVPGLGIATHSTLRQGRVSPRTSSSTGPVPQLIRRQRRCPFLSR
jgi:hypothetical protein